MAINTLHRYTYFNNGRSNGKTFYLNVDFDMVDRITDHGNRRGILLKNNQHYSVAESIEEIFKNFGIETNL